MHDFLIVVAELVNGWLETQRAEPEADSRR